MRPSLGPFAAAFVLFGTFWGSWAVAAADIESGLHLSSADLGLLLSVAVGAGGIAAAGAGGLAERWGPSRTLATALCGWGAVSLAAAFVPGRAFLLLFVAAMVFAGLVDMAMNTAATAALAGRAGRMVQVHALFNGGALLGAAMTGLFIHGGLSWRWSWATIGAGALILVVPTGRLRRRRAVASVVDLESDPAPVGQATRTGSDGDRPLAARPWETVARSLVAVRRANLAVLAVVFAATTVVEGGIDTWGVLYLRTQLAAGVLVGAGAYAIGQTIAVSTRGLGGPAIGRIGARRGLVVGAAIAAAGLAAEASSHLLILAAAGLALAAGGISLCWPLVMATLSVTDSGDGTGSAALVGAFTASGYLGWVAGPAIVGWVAERAGLASGLGVLAGLAAAAMVTLVLMPIQQRAR